MNEKDDQLTTEALTRLTKELRATRKSFEEIRTLLRHGDLQGLSPSGAVKHLIKHQEFVEELRYLMKRSNRNPKAALEVLLDVEKLLNDL